jgi:tripartite-type tricarboxylate transporter receptor subunit TctC
VFAEKRDANFKDVPTSVELGDKVTLPQFRSIVVRGGTDAKIVKKLSDALAAAAKDPEYVEYLKSQYADPNSFVAGDKADAFFAGELKAMKALAAQVGMTKAEAPAEAKKN